MEDEHSNGAQMMEPEPTGYDEPTSYEDSTRMVEIDLTLGEAETLKAWAMKPAADGSLAIDDAAVKPALVKLGRAIDFARAVAAVRTALEGAGLDTESLSDAELADLGREISQAPLKRGA